MPQKQKKKDKEKEEIKPKGFEPDEQEEDDFLSEIEDILDEEAAEEAEQRHRKRSEGQGQ